MRFTCGTGERAVTDDGRHGRRADRSRALVVESRDDQGAANLLPRQGVRAARRRISSIGRLGEQTEAPLSGLEGARGPSRALLLGECAVFAEVETPFAAEVGKQRLPSCLPHLETVAPARRGRAARRSRASPGVRRVSSKKSVPSSPRQSSGHTSTSAPSEHA